MGDRPVAIVTGASRGIGRSIALELASLGYDLVINRAQDQPPEVLEEAARSGRTLRIRPGQHRRGRRESTHCGADEGQIRPLRHARQQCRHRPAQAHGHPASHRRELRPGPGHQPPRALLPDAACGQLDGRAAKTGPAAPAADRQHRLDLRLHQLPLAGRVLHQQGGRRHDDQALRGPPGRVRHRRLRDQSAASSRRT